MCLKEIKPVKIRLLWAATIRELKGRIAENLNIYRNGDFSFLKDDPSRFFEIDYQIDIKEIAAVKCELTDALEVENCEHVYSALSGITPFLARDERLWIYLTHTELLDYSRKRWPIPDEDEKAISHILTHFFVNGARGIERDNAASRLWWMARISSQSQTLPLKEALQCLLFRSDVRANIIERPTTAQNPLILSAILERLNESYHGDQKLFDRDKFRNFMIELNLLGGVKLLDSLDKVTIDDIVTSLV
jgi:hypothetical protein